MDLQLRGKRALVTGSTSGIGIGIAERLAAEGAVVVVHGRNRERGERVVADIARVGGTVSLVLGDLSNDEGAAAVGDQVVQSIGGIDILVNNAAHTGEGHFDWFDQTPQQWMEIYDAKPVAAVRMIQRFVPEMMERGWGRVVNIGSAAAVQPTAGQPAYYASYAAMLNLTAGLARSMTVGGVTVNTVSPGPIVTPAVEAWARDLAKQQGWPDDWDEIERRLVTTYLPLPVQRIGRVEDIGTAVAFIASPLAGFITGINFRIDGGQIQSV